MKLPATLSWHEQKEYMQMFGLSMTELDEEYTRWHDSVSPYREYVVSQVEPDFIDFMHANYEAIC